MHLTPFSPELSYAVRLAAAFNNLSASEYVRRTIEAAVNDLADACPLIKVAIEHRP